MKTEPVNISTLMRALKMATPMKADLQENSARRSSDCGGSPGADFPAPGPSGAAGLPFTQASAEATGAPSAADAPVFTRDAYVFSHSNCWDDKTGTALISSRRT